MSLQAIRWSSLPAMQSCGMQSVTWVAQGIPNTAGLTISITDHGVQQDAPPSSSITHAATPVSTFTRNPQVSVPTKTVIGSSRRSVHRRQGFGNWNGYGESWLPFINPDLVENLDPTLQEWTWPSVNVTQGWYVLTATISSYSISEPSAPFFVANGTSTFPCLDNDAFVHNITSTSTSTSTTLNPSSTHSTPQEPSGTTASGPSFSRSHLPVGAIAGGAAGGAVVILLLSSVWVYNKRRKRHALAFASSYLQDADTSSVLPDPYTATAEQFPVHGRATFRQQEDSPLPSEKQARQPLRHGPRAADVSDQALERLSSEHDEGAQSQVSQDDHVDVESTEMVSVSMRALQRLLRRVGGAISDLQHPEGSDDAVSSTAPPEYEEVVHQ